MLHISVSAKSAGRFLGVAIFIALSLCFVSIFAAKYRIFLGDGFLADVVSTYDRNNDGTIGVLNSVLDPKRENTLLTWYSASGLLLCSVLLAGIASGRGRNGHSHLTRWKVHWKGLAVIFLFLSLDEAAALHEIATLPLRSALNTGGFLYFAWVIVGAFFVLVLALVYLGFLRDLPATTRRLIVVAGTLYIAGALGMEMVAGYEASLHGSTTLAYTAITTIAEGLEMLGIVLFSYALMRHPTLLDGT